MYRSFTVRNFRGLRDLTVESLERVNLIVGQNNVGKTALLEAIWLHSAPNNPRLPISINSFRGLRGLDLQEPFHDLFWKFDSDIAIELRERVLKIRLGELDIAELPLEQPGETSQLSEQPTSTVWPPRNRIVFDYIDETGQAFTSLGWTQVGWTTETDIVRERVPLQLRTKRAEIGRQLTSVFIAARQRVDPREDADRFGELEIKGKHKLVESVMRHVEPRLKRLTVIPRKSLPILYAEVDNYERLIPLPLLGDGMARLSSLALAIASAEDGVVLVDEIENGLHHTVMKKVWSSVAQFAREFNVQLFATTHSHECVKAAHQAFSEAELYDFRLHRLDQVKDTDMVRAVTYDQDTLQAALEIGAEYL